MTSPNLDQRADKALEIALALKEHRQRLRSFAVETIAQLREGICVVREERASRRAMSSSPER